MYLLIKTRENTNEQQIKRRINEQGRVSFPWKEQKKRLPEGSRTFVIYYSFSLLGELLLRSGAPLSSPLQILLLLKGLMLL